MTPARVRLRHLLIRPPQLRALEDPNERKASWLELFFDLVFVVAISQLTHLLIDHPGIYSLGLVLALFVPIWVGWQGYTIYADRFDTDDLVFRGLVLCGMLSVTTMAVQFSDVYDGKTTGFALAYIVLRIFTVLLNVWAWWHVPAARPLVGRYALGYTVSIALWSASLLLEGPARYALWGMGLAFDLSLPLMNLNLTRHLPLHTSHIAERFGLFTVIVLGEGILAVAQGIDRKDWVLGTASVAVAGFFITACLWWVYFNLGSRLMLKKGASVGLYIYIHLPMMLALSCLTTGIHLLVTLAVVGDISSLTAWLMSGGGAVYLLCLCVAQTETEVSVNRTVFYSRMGASAVLLLLAAFQSSFSPLGFVLSSAAVWAVLVLFDARERALLEHHRPMPEGEPTKPMDVD